MGFTKDVSENVSMKVCNPVVLNRDHAGPGSPVSLVKYITHFKRLFLISQGYNDHCLSVLIINIHSENK